MEILVFSDSFVSLSETGSLSHHILAEQPTYTPTQAVQRKMPHETHPD